jgi:hypothetical protein
MLIVPPIVTPRQQVDTLFDAAARPFEPTFMRMQRLFGRVPIANAVMKWVSRRNNYGILGEPG